MDEIDPAYADDIEFFYYPTDTEGGPWECAYAPYNINKDENPAPMPNFFNTLKEDGYMRLLVILIIIGTFLLLMSFAPA